MHGIPETDGIYHAMKPDGTFITAVVYNSKNRPDVVFSALGDLDGVTEGYVYVSDDALNIDMIQPVAKEEEDDEKGELTLSVLHLVQVIKHISMLRKVSPDEVLQEVSNHVNCVRMLK